MLPEKLADKHWAQQRERGNAFFLRITAWLARYCPAWLLAVCVRVVVLYFFLTAAAQRRHIRRYHRRLQRSFPQLALPAWPVWRQFVAFAQSLVDRFAVWQGKIRYADLVVADPDNIYLDIARSAARQQRGAILVCNHIGNVEVCRALVAHHPGFVLNVLVYSRHAQVFNRALQAAGADAVNLIQVTDLDTALMLELDERLQRGEWLAIAADRVPVRGGKTVRVPFLGSDAAFPQGPWLLAGLLRARLTTVFCRRKSGRYHLTLRHFADAPRWQRHNRAAVVQDLASRYAAALAENCAEVPEQWFNFYDFWGDDAEHSPPA